MEHRRIAFIGAGNMAKSIIARMISNGYPADHICASSPDETHRSALSDAYGIATTEDNLQAANDADVVVFAVKPQIMEAVCNPLQILDFSSKLVITVAAGISYSRYLEYLGQPLNLVRVMPNTPALVGLGMSGLYAPNTLPKSDRAFAHNLLESVGEVCWVEEEDGINGVIAAAGSAPAYFFLFMEAMQQEAVAQGFDEATARQLVQQTALGAAEMVRANADLSIATLREQVTSKGGTTAEAIRTFNENALSDIVAKAMQAAVARAKEMETLF
uniref:pyrroline-5-carboxylate reductase n=1 Tax=Thaumasiovibrio occultus TaxID=1891184 RepID=UPI000B351DA8|nr:pyrroline-5-carboxylate reductase [Thaumasiovibrio occultus]